MSENTPSESEKSASRNYLKYLLLFALVVAAALAASIILGYSLMAFSKQVLGIDIFSLSVLGPIYLALFVWLLLRALRNLTRRVKDVEQQLSKSQQTKYIPVRIVLAVVAIVPVFGWLFYNAPLDPFGFKKQRLESELHKSLEAWSDSEIEDYDLDLHIRTPIKDCPPVSEVRLSVRKYKLVQVLDAHNQIIPIGEGSCSYTGYTVPHLLLLADDIVEKYDPAKDYLSISYNPAFGFISSLSFEHCDSNRIWSLDRSTCQNTYITSSHLRWDNVLTEISVTTPVTATPAAP